MLSWEQKKPVINQPIVIMSELQTTVMQPHPASLGL